MIVQRMLAWFCVPPPAWKEPLRRGARAPGPSYSTEQSQRCQRDVCAQRSLRQGQGWEGWSPPDLCLTWGFMMVKRQRREPEEREGADSRTWGPHRLEGNTLGNWDLDKGQHQYVCPDGLLNKSDIAGEIP